MSKYLGTSHVFSPNVPIVEVVWGLDDKNTTEYDLEYYDLVIANILLSRHRDIKCEHSATMAELITRMGYEGLIRLGILNHSAAVEFCNSFATHHQPKPMHLYQYINWILRFDETVVPYWFYYTLLMFAFTNSKRYGATPYRSRTHVGCIHQYGLTKFTDYVADRKHDVLAIRDKIKRVIIPAIQDERYESDTGYLVDSLREFSIIMFAALLSRSCKWNEFKQLGLEVLGQKLIEHQNVVDQHYKNLVNI